MQTIIDLISFLIILCDIAAGTRILYCLIRIKSEPDEASSYGKKISNIMIFLILANVSMVLMQVVKSYFT